MKTKQILLYTITLLLVEVLIYLWAAWTSTLESSNFFAIEPAFIFDKAARNSGRISSAINLAMAVMLVYYGFSKIYANPKLKDRFRLLITLFAINHCTHFLFVYQNFSHHQMNLSIGENLHGFITFIGLLTMPFIVWIFAKPNKILFSIILINLLNQSYFIMETFFNKIKPDKPAYHNQFGIYITALVLIMVVFKFIGELRKT